MALTAFSAFQGAVAAESPAKSVAADEGCVMVVTETRGGVHMRCGEGDWHSPRELEDKFLHDAWFAPGGRPVISTVDGLWQADRVDADLSLVFDRPVAVWARDSRGIWLRPWGDDLRHVDALQGADEVQPGLPEAPVRAVAFDRSGRVYAATLGAGVYRLDATGGWARWGDGPAEPSVLSIAISGDDTVWAGTHGGGLYRFTADEWTRVRGVAGRIVTSLLSTPARLLAGTRDAGLWSSSDGGRTWHSVDALANVNVQSLALDDSNGIVWCAAYDRGVYRSADAGGTWRRVAFEAPASIERLAQSPRGALFILSKSRGILVSEDRARWQAVPAPFEDTADLSLAVDSRGRLLAGSPGNDLRAYDLPNGSWQSTDTPFDGVLALRRTSDDAVYAVAERRTGEDGIEANLYRESGGRWSRVTTEPASAQDEGGYYAWDVIELAGGRVIAWGAYDLLERGKDDIWRWTRFGTNAYDPPTLDARGSLWSERGGGFHFALTTRAADWETAEPGGVRFSVAVPSGGGWVAAGADRGVSRLQANRDGGFDIAQSALDTLRVQDLVRTPDGAVVVATRGGLFESVDGGTTWRRVPMGE